MIFDKRLIKSIILSILLLIFCFILVIFDVKAEELVYSHLYDVHDITMYFYDPAEDRNLTDNFDINKVETYLFGDYLTFYKVIDSDYPLNEAPRHFYGIRGNLENHEDNILYYAYVVYSPVELNVHAVCMWNPRPQSNCSNVINGNDENDPKITTIQLDTQAGNYFYIVSWKYQQYFRQNVTGYGIQWTNNDNDYLLVSPSTYTITGLYTFNTIAEQTQFITDVSDIINNIQIDDPNINQDVDFNGIYSSTVDTNDWNNTFDNWNISTSFGSTTPVSNLVALPITFLSAVNNTLNVNYCNSVNYITLYNYTLVLPCPNLSQRLGSVWTTIDLIFSLMLIFSIGKSLVKTFARLSDMDTNIMYECYSEGMTGRSKEV